MVTLSSSKYPIILLLLRMDLYSYCCCYCYCCCCCWCCCCLSYFDHNWNPFGKECFFNKMMVLWIIFEEIIILKESEIKYKYFKYLPNLEQCNPGGVNYFAISILKFIKKKEKYTCLEDLPLLNVTNHSLLCTLLYIFQYGQSAISVRSANYQYIFVRFVNYRHHYLLGKHMSC